MFMRFALLAVAVAACALSTPSAFAQARVVTYPDAPHAPGAPYAAGGLPDRIMLTPGADPARSMAVSFRTDARQASAAAEIARGVGGPRIAPHARPVAGVSAPLDTGNGAAVYHQVRFEGLQPDSAYVYRVRGADGWSEWISFRTAAETARPFRFIYIGDLQVGILDHGARVVREALLATARPALVLHAGDLVDQREDMVHDDEWGEWSAVGGWAYASVPQVPAAGNHEYLNAINPDGGETRVLAPHWPRQFALPANGAPGVEATTYFVDYQGVRFVILDATAAIDLGALDSQTAWLDRVLADAGSRWTIVLMHQPVLACHREDVEPIASRWRPIFAARGVDLVLQGHDHCYGRWSDASPASVAQGPQRRARTLDGPVYLLSVAGAKMYALNDQVRGRADRWAEDTQLYQVIEVDGDRLRFAAYAATGALYDSFELERRSSGRNRLVEGQWPLPPSRECRNGQGPDLADCAAEE
jgi:hypothetical protein